MNDVNAAANVEPLVVEITHEPFLPWFIISYDGGKTEELEHEECLAWFKARGAKNMDAVNDAINQAFNFHKATVVIGKPVTPVLKVTDLYTPRV